MKARWAGIVARVLWYALALYAGLQYLTDRLLPAIESAPGTVARVTVAREIAGLIVILALFALADLGLRRAIDVFRDRTAPEKAEPARYAFPDGVTVVVGAWLGLFAVLAIAGLLVALGPLGDGGNENMTAAFVAMTAAGIGSAVATIVGYLKHASELQDFDMAYVPWYFARPVMGLLLGLIFFLLLKAGLLATFPETASQDTADVNDWGVAGIGALVGLFSKPAIDKLKEVFNVLFRTEEERNRELFDRLPEDLKVRMADHLNIPTEV